MVVQTQVPVGLENVSEDPAAQFAGIFEAFSKLESLERSAEESAAVTQLVPLYLR